MCVNYTTIHHINTYLLTPWCIVLLEKLTGLQLVKKFPAFHGTRRFITALTSVCHLHIYIYNVYYITLRFDRVRYTHEDEMCKYNFRWNLLRCNVQGTCSILLGVSEEAVQEMRYGNVMILIDVVEGRTGYQSDLNTVLNFYFP